MPAKRLLPQPNEWIDRSRRLSFVYEGERLDAFEGDVVTSALLANNKTMLARSFKYHRPRGVLSFANHDANVLLTAGDRTNVRGDLEPVVQGRSYRAVNTIGGLRFDAAQVLQAFSKILPVGFYYKAFYRPRFLFPYWERLIREMAGLGKVDRNAAMVRHSRRNRFCDVLIIGGGLAGISAARQFCGSGLDVLVVDENRRFGGSIDYQFASDAAAQAEKNSALGALEGDDSIELISDHFAAGFYADNSVPLIGAAGLVHVHAKQVIIATGVYEQPAVFRHNDLPGVMLASGAQRLIHRFGIAPCENAVVLAGNDEAYAAAIDCHRAGIRIAAIVDLDDPNRRGEIATSAMAHGIQIIPNAHIEQAHGRKSQLAKVSVRANDSRSIQTLECDGILMSVGWAPAAGLLHQAGAKLEYDAAVGQIVPSLLPKTVHAAGRVNGVFDYADQINDGIAAAKAALAGLGSGDIAAQAPPRAATAHSHPYPIFAHAQGKDFIDFDEDLTVGDLGIAYREGFDSIELMKRYSTIGMGPSQGKHSNMNGVRVLAHLSDREPSAIGATTPRPFTYPVPMGTLAGRRLRRHWCTPMHGYHQDRAADIDEAGTWLRPMSYTRGSPLSAIEREYQAVRERVGLIDVSTLGKIELFGADTIALLEYAYTCSFDKLKTGMTRYIFMVDGSGTLVDDGVAARISDDHFYITATSSHAQAVVRQLQQYVDQLDLNVAIVDRTFQTAAVNLAGPHSREVLGQLCDEDLSAAAFPYLAVREMRIAGVEARVMRVGFVGELGYEIHFPASFGAGLWQALMEAGERFDIAAFGVAAQRLLRLEKGHLIFGQDTDGTTNPFEVNLGWGVRLTKNQFVGKHSLALLKPRLARKLVGFTTSGDALRKIAECHLLIEQDAIVGRVTSVAYSPHCRAVIGLAMVDVELSDIGRSLTVRVGDGGLITVTIAEMPFYDAENSAQNPT